MRRIDDLDVVTLAGAIEATGKVKRTIQRWLAEGEIRTFVVGGVKLYALDDVVKVQIAKEAVLENPMPNRRATGSTTPVTRVIINAVE